MKYHLLTNEDFLEDDKGKYWVVPLKDLKGNNLRVPELGSMGHKGTKSKEPRSRYKRVRAVWMLQSGKRFKVILLEELQLKSGKLELRFCYWTITGLKNKKFKGVWWWGQSALIVPKADIEGLLDYAAKRGMISLNEIS
jgi:hypothetical protein